MTARESRDPRTVAELSRAVFGRPMTVDALFDLLMDDVNAPPPGQRSRSGESAYASVSADPPAGSLSSPLPTFHAARQLTELEIRERLRSDLCDAPTTELVGVVEEFWVPSLHVRADLVEIGAQLHAYEIKSDADTLKRLPNQVDGFGRVFDRCSLVAATRHLEKAIDLIPDWWGVLAADPAAGIQQIRPAGCNPQVDVEILVRLLWRDEVMSALVRSGVEPDLIGGRAGMWRQLVEALDVQAVRTEVRAALSTRSAWKEEEGRSRFTAVPAPAC